MTTPDPIQVIADLFASDGAREYLGEPVTQASHMLQAAALAQQCGAPPALVAAALLHDVGHFTSAVSGHDLMRGTDNRHSDAGAVAGEQVGDHLDWVGGGHEPACPACPSPRA